MGDDKVINTQKFDDSKSIAQFARMIGIAEKNRQRILDDPIKYINIANERLMKACDVFSDLKEAAYIPTTECLPDDPIFEPGVEISAEEYQSYKRILDIINSDILF